MLFGSKSEKRKEPDPTAQQQHSLFDEAEATIEISPEVEGIVHIPAQARKKCGRRPLPADLPRADVNHDLSEVEKVCACAGVESEGGAVKLAPMPPQSSPHGIVTPGLLADILIAKFARLGVELSRVTVRNWALVDGGAFEPLMELLLEDIRSGP